MTIGMADVAENQARYKTVVDERDTNEMARCLVCGDVYDLDKMATATECVGCVQEVFDDTFAVIGRRCL